MNVRRVFLPVLAALALGGCDWVGDKEAVVTLAETEGIYVDVGELDYQVQLSRQLNVAVEPDKGYLAGMPDYVTPLTEDEVWFAVSLRVQNQTDKPAESAEEFEIEDTTGKVFHPIPIKAEDNPLAYEARTIGPGEEFPPVNSAGADSPTQGGQLLFKIPYSSLGNRPLEFRITHDGEEAVVDIDV
jgi:hypothetical protein